MVPRAGCARVLVGVDGGASGVRAHSIEVLADASLCLGEHSFEADYALAPGFEPVPIEQQAAELHAPVLGAAEREQGRRWIAAMATCIAAVARDADLAPLVGIGMPGRKTADGRGLALVRNGPRIPDFLDRLEARLAAAGLEAEPIARLLGDGECCGLGEERATTGLLRGMRDAYYVASGTGVAEALKLDSSLVTLDELSEWFPKAWQLQDERGESIESSLSIAALNRRWLRETERPRPLRPTAWLEDHADADAPAAAALAHLGTALAGLLHQRLVLLGERGRTLQRIVIGQRLAQLWTHERARAFLTPTTERELARLLVARTPDALAAPYLEPGDGASAGLREGLLVASELRAAPALGAASAALEQLDV